MKIYGNSTTNFYDRIITLKEFLEKFAQYDIKFAIELKGEGVEEDTLNLIKEYDVFNKTTFTSFKFEYIKKIKELCPDARVGWLTDRTDDKAIEMLKDIGGEEIAPMAEVMTEELMKKWRSNGIGVRAWGVSSTELMKKMCELQVDGMTVNFPDRLFQYLKLYK